MKKRLLSAALALAMVLTLLPVSVFAATDATSVDDGTQVTMAADGTTLTWTYKDADNKNQTGTNTFTSGVIVGNTRSSSTGTVSGKYYSDFDATAYAAGTSFTLLGDEDLPTPTDGKYKNITVDLNGHTLDVGSLEWTLDSNNKVPATYSSFNNLTVKNTGTATDGAVSGSISVKGMNFTLNMTNAASASSDVTAELDNTGLTTSNTLSVTLSNSVMGTITAKNAKINVKASKGSKTGNVMTSNDGTNGANSRTGGSVTLETISTIDGTLGMYGQGTVSLSGRSEITGETTLYGGTKAENNNTAPNWKTTMTVDNSTTGAITQDDGDENGHKIDVKNNSTVGNITMNKGGTSDIDITSSKPATGPAVSIAAGTVDIKNSNVGNVTAGKSGETSGVTITVGTRSQADTSVVGNIAGVSDGASPKLILNGGKVGTIGGTDGKTPVAVSHEVWGGSAKTAIDKANLKGGLDQGYQVKDGNYYTYTTKFQDVVDIFADNSSAKAQLVGETLAGTGDFDITFQWENAGGTAVTLAKITLNPKGNYLTMPTEVNKTAVQYWYDQTGTTGHDEGLQAGKPYLFKAAATLSSKIGDNPAQQITGVKAVDANDSNYPIDATINSTTKTINLSGALKTNGGTGTATVTLEIDGTDLTNKISVGWHAATGTITVDGTDGSGLIFPIKRSNQVQIFDTLYTITGTGLKDKVSKVEILSTINAIPITVSNANGGMSGSYTVTGQNLKKALETVADSNVDFSDATGVKAALNALVAGLSSSTSMASSAQSAVAGYNNKYNKKASGSWAAKDFPQYDIVELSPYLDIVAAGNPTISGSGNPSITLTMTLKYRYKVKDAGGRYAPKDKDSAGNDIYWEQTGNLNVSGDCGPVTITLKMPTELAFANSSTSYVHHDGQVYEAEWDGNATEIENLNGFGVTRFEINNTAGAFAVTTDGDLANTVGTYDTLQDAVDAVKNSQQIVAGDNFNGTINVSGAARKFIIKAASGKTVTITGVNGASTTYEYNTSSKEYEIQLSADTAPIGGNITITTVTGGSAAVNANPAKVGSTVTITLNATAGYKANGVTVRTASGQNVSVSGSGNTYTFTMPNSAVTVTPSFALSDGRATINVGTVSGGSLITSALTSDNKAQQGSTVTMTAIPSNSAYRTMGVTARTNTGATVATTRTGTNTFSMVVPSGATTVTVTPDFDINNGTLFTDVRSNHWASSYIAWAYQNKYIEGTGTYTYSPAAYMTLGEVVAMLYKAAGSPSTAGMSNPFTNLTPNSHWAYNALVWAANQGLISGGTINPWGYASRAEIVEILYRRAGRPSVSGTSGFADVASSASYARAVTWARQQGLTNGYNGKTYFRPTYAVSRAEMAAFLQRAFG